mgnify:CR=1 FL=1
MNRRLSIFFAFILLLAPVFSIYSFNINVTKGTNISLFDEYPSSDPERLFYEPGEKLVYFTDKGVPAIFYTEISTNETSKMGGNRISSPSGIYMNSSSASDIYIADLDLGFKRLSSTSSLYDAIMPHSVWYYGGRFYLTDYSGSHIVVLNSNGDFVTSFGMEGQYDGFFKGPEDIQFFNSTMYVADSGNSRVSKFTANFSVLGSYGNGQGGVNLLHPTGIFVDKEYVYVADPDGNQVVIYTQDGYPIFVYNTTNPRDVLVVDGAKNKVMYITKGYESMVLIKNISISSPSAYVNPLYAYISGELSGYIEAAQVAPLINVSANASLAQAWNSADAAYRGGAWGEAYYKMMALNSTTRVAGLGKALSSDVAAKLSIMAQNSTEKAKAIRLIEDGNYTDAYSVLISAPRIQNTTANTTANNSAPGNQSIPVNVTSPVAYNTSSLQVRLDASRALASKYGISQDYSELESIMQNAKTNRTSFDAAESLLASIESRVVGLSIKIDGAQNSIDSLRAETANPMPFVDYIKAIELLANAESVLASDPAKAEELASAGMAEAQKARDSANLIYIAIVAVVLLILIVLIAVAFLAFQLLKKGKGGSKPPRAGGSENGDGGYHFRH